MNLVNTSVISISRTLLPWTILQVLEVEHSISDFFDMTVRPRISDCNCELLTAYIGQDKSSLDQVDTYLPVVAVTSSFGRYLKYSVSVSVEPFQTNSQLVLEPSDNTSPLSAVLQPVNQRTKKDKLYNDILGFFVSANVTVKLSEVSCIKKFITLLRDIFWHIDGHHHAFEQRAQPIPSMFDSFTGYNRPEQSKHRKRLTMNMSSDCLQDFSLELSTQLQISLWDRPVWIELKPTFTALLFSLTSYTEYLVKKNKRVKMDHRSPTPVRDISEHMHLKLVASSSESINSPILTTINDCLLSRQLYEVTYVSHLLPCDSVQKHRAVNTLISNGLNFSVIILVYAPGGNVGNFHFIWKVPSDATVAECFERSQSAVEEVKQQLPVYHSRAMKSAMFKKFGRISAGVKPAALRYFYKDLTGDQSASSNLEQSQIDRRIIQLIDMEDSDIVMDLRAFNGNKRSQYDTFWEECQKFLNEDMTDAVDDRRHGCITHLGRAISIRDFVEQVKQRCPEGTLIPSCEWLRLQFWPKTPSATKSLHHTGRFKLKFMVQQRQWRHQHIDSHYAAACFRYLKEYAISVRPYCCFVSFDDKHKVKVGEPGYPVAAAERGRRVLVREDEYLTVGDHDFTKFSLIPSVIFVIDVPEEISGSWFTGSVFVGLKDAVFEHSTPLRHSCELYSVLQSLSISKPILFLYSDGGPDHRLTYMSVKLSLICLFLMLNLDYLCAARTAPYHSWKNPVERIMSLLNLGLQCIGLARAKMPDEYEKEVNKCNNLSGLRKHLEGKELVIQDSLSPVKVLLCRVFSRLKLHDEEVRTFASASPNELDDFWSAIIAIDATLHNRNAVYRQETMNQHQQVLEFIKHCCQASHYGFDILKCGKSSCKLCSPVRLPQSIFENLHHMPHPVPGDDGHYLSFLEVFGTLTTEEHRPSFKKRPFLLTKRVKRRLPFHASVQHVKNVDLMVQCTECNLWRLIFSKYKLSKEHKIDLLKLLDDHMYSCGASLRDLDLPANYDDVDVRDHDCYDPIEKLYYSAKNQPICVYCAKDQPYTSENSYPICSDCESVGNPVIVISKKKLVHK